MNRSLLLPLGLSSLLVTYSLIHNDSGNEFALGRRVAFGVLIFLHIEDVNGVPGSFFYSFLILDDYFIRGTYFS